MPATSNTFRHQPRSRGLFLGVERGHALPGQPDRGTSADPDPTASRGRSPGGPRLELRLLAATVQSWDSGLTPRAAAATPGGPCSVPLGLLDF